MIRRHSKIIIIILPLAINLMISASSSSLLASENNKVNGTIQKAHIKESYLQMSFSFHINRDSVIESPGYELNADRNETVGALRAARIKTLKYLPINVQKIFPNLLRYDATSSSVLSVTRDNFAGLKKLKALLLRRNDISFVAHDTFNDLIALQELFLSDNKIRQIDERTFEHLPNLRELNLANNQLSELPLTLFANLFDLNEIDISGNALTTLDAKIFMNNMKVIKVQMNHNKISKLSVKIFAQMRRLTAVGLVGNVCVDDFYTQSDLQRMRVEIEVNCEDFSGTIRSNRSIEVRSVRRQPAFSKYNFKREI